MFFLYTDYKTKFIKGENLQNISIISNTELKIVSNSTKINKLTLNINKAHFMVFSPLIPQSAETQIVIDHIVINEAKELKFYVYYQMINQNGKPIL